MSTLAWTRYGKCQVRLMKVRRRQNPHEIVDATIAVQLEGAFDRVYVDGDNSACLATDTMKNTVYALARRESLETIEAFALRLADHFIRKPHVTVVRIGAVEHPWSRLAVNGCPHPHAFLRAGAEHWTTTVVRDPHGTKIASGLANLVVLKTTDSAFAGFPRDELTTLPETDDRILATSVTASWKYGAPTDFAVRERIRAAMLETFAAHVSQSVQHTLYAMAEAALAVCENMTEITISLPNRHHLLADLTPFGLDNPNEVFVPTEQPFGLIEATVLRSEK
jgi:urate oxidase